MASDESDSAVPPSDPIFELDLGSNGGVLAPTSGLECRNWIEIERQFWQWITQVSAGNHRSALDAALNPLHQAANEAQQAIGYEHSNQPEFRRLMLQVSRQLEDCFGGKTRFPHSSTPLAKRVEQIRTRDPLEALAYLYVHLPQKNGYQFDARDASSWRGFIEGLIELHGISTISEERHQALQASLDELRTKSERTLGQKRKDINRLHKEFVQQKEAVDLQLTNFEAEALAFFQRNQEAHDLKIDEHEKRMAALQNSFREEMALRAPVEYWEGRKTHHEGRATITGWWAFGSMAGLAGIIGSAAYWVLSALGADGKPDTWRVAVLALVGALGVWAVRLIVRMFLSHTHLTTDAAERVTMVKTYLALLESDKMPSDDDRKLILQSLFRPAADGIVKDEGLPNPLLEVLTRTGNR